MFKIRGKRLANEFSKIRWAVFDPRRLIRKFRLKVLLQIESFVTIRILQIHFFQKSVFSLLSTNSAQLETFTFTPTQIVERFKSHSLGHPKIVCVNLCVCWKFSPLELIFRFWDSFCRTESVQARTNIS